MRHFLWLLLLLLVTTPLYTKEALTTLPERDHVQLTIYNEVDLTFVREQRTLSFKAGQNLLEFSWAHTLIDPSSVTFEPQGEETSDFTVMDISYPPESGEKLIWTIECEEAGSFPINISYFTSGISWTADYQAKLNPERDSMLLQGDVTIFNNSGEEYEDAQVRLIIGNVHLVEPIRRLAEQARWSKLNHFYARPKNSEGRYEANEVLDLKLEGEDSITMEGGGGMGGASKAKKVEKEKLSEYFIYTIEGYETIPDTWAKRLVAIKPVEVSTQRSYFYQPEKFGEAFVRVMEFNNDQDHGLGNEPMPPGNINFYTIQSNNQLSYITSITIDYLPVGEEAQWNLGADPLVNYRSRKLKEKRKRLDFSGFGKNTRLVGYDMELAMEIEILNHHDFPVSVEFYVNYPHPDYDLSQTGQGEKEDYQTYKWRFEVPGKKKESFNYTVTFREGTNRKPD